MYTFDDILKFLGQGREIEFAVDGKLYGIVNFDGYWLFCCGPDYPSITLAEFEDRTTLKAKVADKEFIGLDIKSIINNRLYEEGSLDIM